MDLFDIRDKLAQAGQFNKTSNYYYQTHLCNAKNAEVKVMLDYKLKTEISDNAIKFGFCPYCNDTFYHETHESKDY